MENQTSAAALKRDIARFQSEVILLEASRAEVAYALQAKPDDVELNAQLAKIKADIQNRQEKIEDKAAALVVAQSRDVKAEEEAHAAALAATKKATCASMAEGIKVAKEADKHRVAYLASLVRLKEINAVISRGAYDLGVSGSNRHHLTSIATAGDVLAWHLMQTGLYDQLSSVIVHRPSVEGRTFAEIVEANFQRLDSWIDRAMRGREGR